MNNQDILHKEVWSYLNTKIQEDELFKLDLQNIYFFYESKLLRNAQAAQQRQLVKERFEDAVYGQLFQGYYMMRTILNDDELELEEEVWEMGESVARNEIPIFLKEVFKEGNVDWSHTELSHALGMDILNDFESAYELYEKARLEIAYYGAYKAFLDDSRYKGKVTDPDAATKLGNPLEIEFLSPQVYMNVYAITDENEIWNLHYWSGTQPNTWVGNVQFIQLPINGRLINRLNVNILSIISKEEREMLLNQLISRIPGQYRKRLETYLFHVEDFDLFYNFHDIDSEDLDYFHDINDDYELNAIELKK